MRKQVTMSVCDQHFVWEYKFWRDVSLQAPTQPTFWIIVLGLFGLAGLFLYFENTSLQLTEYQISFDTLPKEFDGFRIALVSDLHGSVFGKGQSRLVSKISDFQPDIITIAGDLFDEREFTPKPAEIFIENCKDIAPLFYVTGNHEIYSPYLDSFVEAMRDHNITFLRNDVAIIRKGSSEIALIGIDDPLVFSEHSQKQKEGCARSLSGISSKIDEDTFTILLSHRPDFIEIYASSDIDLVLSGHAHGGMIRIPGIGGVISPGQGFMPKYTEGVYREKQTTMVVSRGLGNSGRFQVRIFNRPEIVLITLTR